MNEKPRLAQPVLNRQLWHRPLVSVVVTHHNYSPFLSEALLSVLDQTYENWECIVVDDGSDPDHLDRARWTTERIDDPRMKFLALGENVGQIPAFYAGMDALRGEFVCLLDPDDRFAETFLEETLAIHLNTVIACPIVSTDQFTLTKAGVTTSVQKWFKRQKLAKMGLGNEVREIEDFTLWIPPEHQDWVWASTSSLLFRRAALKYTRPHKRLDYNRCADAYLANGAHLLGGTLCYTKPLVYRSLHEDNSYISKDIFSSRQARKKPGGVNRVAECRTDVFEALLYHEAPGVDPEMLYRIMNPPLSRNIPKLERLLTKTQQSLKKRRRRYRMLRGLSVHPFLLE